LIINYLLTKKTNINMKKILIVALSLVAFVCHAQSRRVDSSTLAIHTSGRNFTVTAADFGSIPTEDLMGEMVMAYDTVMVMKADTKADSSGKKPMLRATERRATKMSNNLKDKIALIEYNKDADVTQTCLNAQKAGAKAIIIIHESNEKKLYKLVKKGLYKDSITIPCYTVPNKIGDKITELLPTMIGIAAHIAQPQSRMSSNALNLEAQVELEKSRIDWESNTGGQTDYFVVERLNTQTGQFAPIETFNSTKQTGLEQLNTYDPKPEEGDNNYRIKSVQLDGSVVYSEVKTVNFNKLSDIKIFPNPTEDEINISLKGYANKNIDFTLYDMQGKPIHTEQIDALQSNIHTIMLKQKTTSGQYMLRIKAQGKRDVIKLVTIKQ
jgi:hypothetical protein